MTLVRQCRGFGTDLAEIEAAPWGGKLHGQLLTEHRGGGSEGRVLGRDLREYQLAHHVSRDQAYRVTMYIPGGSSGDRLPVQAGRAAGGGEVPHPGRVSRTLKAALGRPRNETIDKQVVSTVLRVLRTRGYKAVTIDGIARTVKRARASLYRRWPSKPHLVAYCIVSTLGASPAPDTGALRKDLLAAVATLRRGFSGPLRQALPGLVADMANDPKLAQAIRRQVLAPRRKSMREALDRARARGEARQALDTELLLDLLAGPFYFRTLFGHARVDRRMTQELVDYVLKIIARRR